MIVFGSQICPMESSVTVKWIDEQMVPYAVQGKAWVGFDNHESFAAKVNQLLVFRWNKLFNMLLTNLS